MAVFRVEKNHNYTVMANYHLKDIRLSLKAKGLMSVMLSLPDDWDYTLRGLACICKEGVDAIREAIRELERAGYILRSRERNEKGQMKNTEYVIYEEPQEPQTQDDADEEDYAPILGSPTLEKPTLENPTLDHPLRTYIGFSNIGKAYVGKSNIGSSCIGKPSVGSSSVGKSHANKYK